MSAWGADAQFTRLVEQHGTALLRLAVLLTGNRFDGEDALQEALISVAASWKRTRPQFAVAYLKKSVAHACFDLMKKRRDISVADVPDAPVHERRFLKYEDDQQFFALVDTLPDRQRSTLILRYFADLDDRAIAEILGVTPETVRSQAHRGLEKLRSAVPAPSGKDAS